VSKRKDTPGSIFKEQAAKLGIPKDGTTFDTKVLHAVWAGSGDKCAEIVSSVEKKALHNSFVKESARTSCQIDPTVEKALEKFKDRPEPRREYVFRKDQVPWRATLLMEHNLGSSSEEDTATIVFFLEEI
jgi:hypothetical protein